MKTTSKTSLIACIAISGAFAGGFASGPASAQDLPHRGPFEFKFRYDASEMGSLAGAQNLLTRLEAAVSTYCGEDKMMSPKERADTEKCVDKTMRESITKFGNATVAQAFQSRADG